MANILAFGEVMMRLEVLGNKRLFQTKTLEYSFSGTGVNILSGLGHFGHEVKLLSKLPANSLGEAAKAYINSLGIDTSNVIYGDNYLGMYF